jgi:hypothetical protein
MEYIPIVKSKLASVRIRYFANRMQINFHRRYLEVL